MSQPEKSEKQRELETAISTLFTRETPSPTEVVSAIVDGFCDIKPPQTEARLHNIRINSTYNSGVTTKPGNILLNWRKLHKAIPDIVLTGAGVGTKPFLIFLAALKIWDMVWSLTKIELAENHALVMYIMWENRDENRKIPEDIAFTKTNHYLAANNKPQLSLDEFTMTINDLIKMSCVEVTDGVVWLREWVKQPY